VKEKLCKQLLKDRTFKTLAFRFAGNMADDLLQEVAEVICNKSDKELEKINDYFNFWVSRTIMNMGSSTGQIGRIKKHSPIPETINIEEEKYNPVIDEQAQRVEEILKEIYWYKSELFRTYMDCGTYRAVEDLTGIDHVSVYHTVKEVKKILKERL